jgi:hypothetical protein
VASSCEFGNEPSGSIKMLRIYRVAAQLEASRAVLSSTEIDEVHFSQEIPIDLRGLLWGLLYFIVLLFSASLNFFNP